MASGRPIWVAGAWKETPECLTVTNPYNGETVGTTYLASAEDVEAAIVAAEACFIEMRSLSAFGRAEGLQAISDGIRARGDVFASTIAQESGKPLTDARKEVSRAVQTFKIAAEEAKRIEGSVIPLDLVPGSEGRIGLTQRKPIGPVVGISPFNFPLNLVAHKIAPALASGNTIILKPSPRTPLTALMLAEVIASTYLPRAAVSIFPCANALTEKMVTDRRVKMVTFTGSADVGWAIKKMASDKRVLLELGGNAGVIVHSDADIEAAARAVAVGGFAYAGQVCISVQRVYVHQTIKADFLDHFLPKVQALRAGNPMDEATTMGVLIDPAAACRIEQWVGEAVSQGAKILCGGKRQGTFFEPTVLDAVTETMRVNAEEIFGPVVTLSAYQTLDEAITRVNASRYGLQAGLFTRDMPSIFHAFDRLEVGGLVVNDVPTYRVDHMPYGGMKDSGFGREGVRYAIEEMTETKLMALKLS